MLFELVLNQTLNLASLVGDDVSKESLFNQSVKLYLYRVTMNGA